MKIEEYLKLEGLTDVETQADFIQFVAEVDEINNESVKHLDYTESEWNNYRDEFFDVC